MAYLTYHRNQNFLGFQVFCENRGSFYDLKFLVFIVVKSKHFVKTFKRKKEVLAKLLRI